jgi:hypothetical protein
MRDAKAPDVDSLIRYENGELTGLETADLFQRLIDSDLAWALHGHYGRTAAELIRQGICAKPESGMNVKRS